MDFKIRKATLKDTGKLVEAASTVYKINYFTRAKFQKMFLNPKVTSYIIAEKDESRIMGHVALTNNKFKSAAEIGAAFVHSDYRNKGLLNILTEHAIIEAEQSRINGVFVRAVCSHPYSQRAAFKHGLKDCTLLLSRHNEILSSNKRESLLLAFRPLNKTNKTVLYIPRSHRKITGEIYRNFDIEPVFCDGEASFMNKTVLEVEKNEHFKTAAINIMHAGLDFVKKIDSEVRKLRRKNYISILALLNSTNPSTIYLGRYLLSNGFFFSGVMPGYHNAHILVLQSISNYEIDFDNIQIDSEIGNKLLNHIRATAPITQKQKELVIHG